MKSFLLNHINSLFIAIIAILTPVKALLLTIGFLIAVDFIFGIWRAKKCGEKITSRKMSNTVSKMILYNLSIISVYLLNKYIIETGLPLEKIAAGLIGIVEFKSISESLETMTGIDIYSKLKSILGRGNSTTKCINNSSSTTKDLMKDLDVK